MIILNEKKFAEDVIETGNLGASPVASLYRVAKYYGSKGLKKNEVVEKVLELLRAGATPEQYQKYEIAVGKMASKAYKDKPSEVESIEITENEIEKIKALPNTNLMRLAFTLLCLAKYHTAVKPESGGWVSEPDSDIFMLANVGVTRYERGLLYNDLMTAGLIEFPKSVSSSSVRVAFADGNENGVLHIVDVRNLGYQFSSFIGRGTYARCAVCGLLIPVQRGKKWVGLMYCHEHKEKRRPKTRVTHCPDCGVMHVVPVDSRTDRCPACNEVFRREKLKADHAKLKEIRAKNADLTIA